MAKYSKKTLHFIPICLGLILAFLFFYVGLKQFKHFITDDVYITLRFARNMAEGNGLVFNIGEKVEGYSCFLWAILIAFCGMIGFDYYHVAQNLSRLSGGLSLILVLLIAKDLRLNKNIFWNILPPIIILSSIPSYAAWSSSGMETNFNVLLFLLGSYIYLKELRRRPRFPISSIVFLLFAFSRVDSVLIFLFLILHQIFLSFSKWSNKKSEKINDINHHSQEIPMVFDKKFLVQFWGTLVGGYLLYTIWRVWYYGSLISTPILAKKGTISEMLPYGIKYAISFLTNHCEIFGFIFIFPIIDLIQNPSHREFKIFLWIAGIGFLGFYILGGGDWMPLYRFYVILLPIYLILLNCGIEYLIEKIPGKKAHIWIVVNVISIFVALLFLNKQIKQKTPDVLFAEKTAKESVGPVKIGKWLAKNAPPNSSVAVTDAGAIPYYSGLYIIDLVGIVDPVISRKSGKFYYKTDADYVMRKKPTFIELHISGSDFIYKNPKGTWPGDERIVNHPDFRKYYVPITEDPNIDHLYKRLPVPIKIPANYPDVPKNGALVVFADFPESLHPGENYVAALEMKNTGNTYWCRSRFFYLGACGDFDHFTENGRISFSNTEEVSPGESYKFKIPLKAPPKPGVYQTDWQMVQEFCQWFGEKFETSIEVK